MVTDFNFCCCFCFETVVTDLRQTSPLPASAASNMALAEDTSTSTSPLKVKTIILLLSSGILAGVDGRFGVEALRPWTPARGPLKPTKW